VWFDEIEKALQGATSGSADGGVSSDALGAVLSLDAGAQGRGVSSSPQQQTSKALPPELLRKGRSTRCGSSICRASPSGARSLGAALRAHGREDVLDYSIGRFVAGQCDGFTGSEIAAIVPEAMFAAFADEGREVKTSDLLEAAATVVPLSKTAAEKNRPSPQVGRGSRRPATSASELQPRAIASGRSIDL